MPIPRIGVSYPFIIVLAAFGSHAASQCEFAQTWAEVNESAGYGISLALGPGIAVVGAPRVTGGGLEHGAVYVYSGRPGLPWTWSLTDILAPGDVNNREEFGWSVALDADLLVVGARRGDVTGVLNETGTIYPFIREDDGSWLALPRFRGSSPQPDEKLGETVAVSGTTIVAGSLDYDSLIPMRTDSGRVVVFEPSPQNPDQWVEVQSLLPSTVTAGGEFGSAIAISGNTMIVGAPGSSEIADRAGAAFLYERDALDPRLWNLMARLGPSGLNPGGDDDFGYAVDTDDRTILVGARYQGGVAVKAGRVYAYRRHANTGEWLVNSPIIISPPAGTTNHANFGSSVRVRDGLAMIGAPASANASDGVGQVHLFLQASPTVWNPGPVLRSPDNLPESDFGRSVAFFDDLLVAGDVDWGPEGTVPPFLGFGRTYWSRYSPGEGDCNNDGIPDGCAVATGLSPDCDLDAIPDNCPGGQPISVWLPEFKGVFSDPLAWCDTVPGPSHNAIFNSAASDGLATEVVVIRPELVRGLEVRAGHPSLFGAALGSLTVTDTVDAFDGFPVRVGVEPEIAALDLRGLTLRVGDETDPGSVVLAPAAGAQASMRLEDPDTLLDISLDLIVGDQGSAGLELLTGAQVVCQELRIGSRTDPAGVGAVRLFRSLGAAPNPSLTAHTQVRVERGTLQLERQCTLNYGQMTIEKDGVVRTDAILRGTVLNLGTVETLTSPRDLVVQGDYRQVQIDGSATRIGRLRLDLGSGAPADHDRLEVNQTADFSGGLHISADASFDPPTGSTYEIISANVAQGGGNLNGRFSVASFPGMTGLKFLRLEYDQAARAVRLVVDSLDPKQDADFGGSQNYAVGFAVRDAELGRVTADADPNFADLVLAVGGENPGDPGSIIIFTNDGTPDGEGQQFTGQHTVALATDPMAVDVADVDNDPNGLDDIVIAGADGSVTVLRNLGAIPPAFEVIPFEGVLAGPSDIRVADLDHDAGSRPDIAVIGTDGSGNGVVVTRLNLGNAGAAWGGFGLQALVNTGPGGLTMADIGDLDNDKIFRRDLAALRDDGSSFALCVNLGGGTGVFWDGLAFTQDFDLGIDAVSMDIGDLDNDKDFDIMASGRSGDDGGFAVLLNDPAAGLGAPNVFPLDGLAGPIVLAKLDGDDDLDAAVAIDDPALGPIVRTLRNDLSFDGGVPQLAFSLADVFETNTPAQLLLAGQVDQQAGEDLVIIEDHTQNLPGRGGTLVASVQLLPIVVAEPPECPVDVNGDDIIDFFDLLAFLAAYDKADDLADWNDDGTIDFFDVAGFLGDYSAGCP